MRKAKKPTDRAVAYSRRVVPDTEMKLVDGLCRCQQCAVRRAWLAGYRAAMSENDGL